LPLSMGAELAELSQMHSVMRATDDVDLAYVIIRALPDPLRGEMLNVALVGTYAAKLLIRTLPATRCMQALLSASQLRACELLSETVLRRGNYGFPALESGLIVMQQQPSSAFLDYLHMEGLDGFLIDAPRVQRLSEPSEDAAAGEFSRLYLRLVAPARKVVHDPALVKPRAKTLVSRILSTVDPDGSRIARDLLIRDRRTNAEFDIDFAYANGSLTLGQAVDFQTTPDTYTSQVDHVIATIADLTKVAKAQFLNVVQVGVNSEDYADKYERLRSWGRVIELPTEREFFEQMLARYAQHDVRAALDASGLHVEQSAGGPMDLTATVASALPAPELDF
jgi:hypothetical protein